MLLELAQHLPRVLHHRVVLGPHPEQQPAGQGELAGQERAVGQVVVAQLGPAQAVRLEDRVHGLLRCRHQQPGQVVGRVGHLRLRPAEQRGRCVVDAEHVVSGQVPMHHRGLEAPQGDVLQGPLPPLEQDRRHVTGACRLVHLGQPALAVGVRVVHRQPGVLHGGGGQLVQGGDRPAERRGQPRSGTQQLQPQRPSRKLRVHDGAAPLGQVREPRRARHVEGQPTGVDVRSQRPQQRDLRLQRSPRSRVLWRTDHPASTLGVDHHGRVDPGTLRSCTAHVEGVQTGDGDGREGGQGEGRTGHPPTVGAAQRHGTASGGRVLLSGSGQRERTGPAPSCGNRRPAADHLR